MNTFQDVVLVVCIIALMIIIPTAILRIIMIFDSWLKWLPLLDPPEWVINASNRWSYKQKLRPYDKTKYFKGKTYVYKVYYKTIGQGQIKPQYYRRKRKI